MKTVFFTLRPPVGSYGGGAFFVKNMSKFLTQNGFRVVYDLIPNIDILFIIDPRRDKYNRYSIDDIIKYKWKNPNVKIIHRVNECDIKRKVHIGIENLILRAMITSDMVVFVSNWLKEYYITKYRFNVSSTYILNGVDRNVFYEKIPDLTFLEGRKLRLITHHWSNNYLKGFDIYNAIDKLLDSRDDFEFIYVGNYNREYKPKNIKLIPPKSGVELGNIIRSCDVYITATRNEPGAMHYLEGMSCGLPVLYHSGGGGASEICNISGEEYNDISTFLKKLELVKMNYDSYVKKIKYDFLNSKRCSLQYYELINSL